MILLYFIFVLTTFLAFGVKPSNTSIIYSGKYSFTKKPHYEAVIVLFIFIMLASFAGFRSEYNDTAAYLYNFSNDIPQSFDRIVNIDWSLGQNPGFIIYQIFIKQFISTNQYVFILFTSTIVTYLFVKSFYRYSQVFYFTIFLFIASGLFIFTMAAMKQVLAMSIGFWSIRFFLKEKYLKFIFIIILASTFHPYILLYLLAFFFRNGIKSTLILQRIEPVSRAEQQLIHQIICRILNNRVQPKKP